MRKCGNLTSENENSGINYYDLVMTHRNAAQSIAQGGGGGGAGKLQNLARKLENVANHFRRTHKQHRKSAPNNELDIVQNLARKSNEREVWDVKKRIGIISTQEVTELTRNRTQ